MDKKDKKPPKTKKKNLTKKNIVPFVFSKKTSTYNTDEKIIDEGTIGNLDYKVFSRGVIHIFDKKKKALFKKDCTLFEDALEELKLNTLTEGDVKEIPGSGDNDTLVFTCKEGDIIISLEKPEYNTIKKLKKILKLGCKKKTDKQA